MRSVVDLRLALGAVGDPGADGLSGSGKYPWAVFSPRGPSLRELAMQALSSVEGGYDLLAPKFDHTPFRSPDGVLDATAGTLRPLGPFGRGLDVCCGTGAGMRVLKSLCQGRIMGVDFSAGMLAQARRAHPDARWVRADVRALPFAGAFDLAVSFGALGHFLPAERAALFAGVYRALRPAGVFAGQEVPERPEADRQVEGPGEGQGPDVGPYPPGVRVRPARLREHASAEVDAHDPSLAQGFKDPHARAGAAAHVQSPAERAERAQRAGGRVKHAIGAAERRVVELRSKQVVAALDRGQRLHRQFTQRRAPGREHRPRVLPRCQAGRQPRHHPPHPGPGADQQHSGPEARASVNSRWRALKDRRHVAVVAANAMHNRIGSGSSPSKAYCALTVLAAGPHAEKFPGLRRKS